MVDRLWPRGLTKERAAIDMWLKDLAPSTELRKWFGHDPVRWKEFQTRYRKELREKKELIQELRKDSQCIWSLWSMEPVMKCITKPLC